MIELPRRPDWDSVRADFRWPRLAQCNIAEQICGVWARRAPDRVALIYLRPDGALREYTYAQLARAAARLANALAAHGLGRGDRCAVLLPQTPEAALTHIACYMLGAVATPLFTLFGEDGLRYRLADSGARIVVTDEASLPKIAAIRDQLPELRAVFSIDRPGPGAWGFWQELGKAAELAAPARTGPDDPAFLSYTSGTTGPPKGALHGHRVLMGHMPGFIAQHDYAPAPGDRIWTPADWAWMGGLTNVMMPALALGIPVVAHRMPKFDPERAVWLMARLEVRNAFMPPTALKLMRQAGLRAAAPLRSLASAGEALGAELLEWGREAFGLTINEAYGQTECNLVLGNCAAAFAPRPGSAGKVTPGHEAAVIDAEGRPLPDGETGEIAVRRGSPSMFLRYWNKPERTAEKFAGEWMRTGDLGRRDAEGYFHFASRADDVITSSGYRIGPTEIEDCVAGDPAVAMAAAVGLPDPIRTEAVTLFVVLRDGAARDGLAARLTARVRERISPHVAPRAVRVVDALPMTATGKIMRRELKRQALEQAASAAGRGDAGDGGAAGDGCDGGDGGAAPSR